MDASKQTIFSEKRDKFFIILLFLLFYCIKMLHVGFLSAQPQLIRKTVANTM